MADRISDILDVKTAQKEIDALGNSINKLADDLDKLAKTTAKATDTGAKEKAKETEQLSLKTREYKKQITQLTTAQEKLRVVNGNYNRAIVKTKLETQEANKAIRDQIKANRAQAGSLADVENKLKKLKEEYKNTAKPSKELVNNIKNLDAQSKKLSKNIGEQQKSVGGYRDALKGLVSGIVGWTAAIGLAIKGAQLWIQKQIEVSKQTNITAQTFNKTKAEASDLAFELRVLSKVLDEDFNTVLKSANVFAKTFGIEGSEAVALITEGFEKGANVSGEYLEILKEYPAQLKSVGLNASQTIALLTQTEQQGIFSDKAVDSIKEAGIRLRELTPATRTALDAIGLSSDKISADLTSGTKTLFDVIQEVGNRLKTLPPQADVTGQAIADIFGGAGEDAGIDFLKTLGDINLELSEVDSTLTDSQKTQAELTREWEKFSRVSGDVFGFLKEIAVQALKSINSIRGFVEDNRLVFAGIVAIGQTIKSVYTVAFNAVKAFLTPLGTLITAISRALSGDFKGALDAFGEGLDSLKNTAKDTKDSLVDSFGKVKDAFVNGKQDVEDINSSIKDTAIEAEKIAPAIEKAVDVSKRLKKELEDIGDIDNIIPENNSSSFFDQFIDEQLNFQDEYEQNVKDAGQRLIDIEADIKEARQQLQGELFTLLGALLEADTERKLDNINQVREAENKAFESQIAQYEGNEEVQAQIAKRQEKRNAELDRQERKIQRQKAIRERSIALFEIALNTAKAISSVSPVVPLMILAGAIGATQAGVVLSEPLPKLFKGTGKDGVKSDTLAVVGDRYGTEGIITPEGKAFLTPNSDTLAYLTKGTQVIPNKDLATNPVFQDMRPREIKQDNSDIIKAIKGIQSSKTVVTDSGIYNIVKRGNNTTTYKQRLLGE